MTENLPPTGRDQLDVQQVSAAISFGWLAAVFVTEPETFPVFMAWMRTVPGGGAGEQFTREQAAILIEELARGMAAAAGAQSVSWAL